LETTNHYVEQNKVLNEGVFGSRLELNLSLVVRFRDLIRIPYSKSLLPNKIREKTSQTWIAGITESARPQQEIRLSRS